MEFSILFQSVLNDIDSGVHWHRCKLCLNIIGDDLLPFFKLDVHNLFHEVLGVFDVVEGHWHMSGLKILASSMATLYVTTPLLDTISLKGVVFFFVNFG